MAEQEPTRSVMRRIARFPAPVFLGLLATNVAILLASCLFWQLRDRLALVGSEVWHGQIWRLVSYAWVHAGFRHLGGNMLFLLPCALYLERRLGSLRFLALYLISVAAGGLVLTVLGQNTIGASGAVCAMLALSVLTLTMREEGPGWLLLPELIAGLFIVVLWVVPMIWGDLTGLLRQDGISHVGHLTGFLTGWGLHRLRLNRPRQAPAARALSS
jgi:membrane associated rhomboid family serine protease